MVFIGDKPYPCDLCDKAYTQPESLAVHKKIHLGENEFPCGICGTKFTRSYSRGI